MIRSLGRLFGRHIRAAFRPPLGHRFLTAAVLVSAAAMFLLHLLSELAEAAFCVAAAIALAYGVLRIVKPDSAKPGP